MDDTADTFLGRRKSELVPRLAGLLRAGDQAAAERELREIEDDARADVGKRDGARRLAGHAYLTWVTELLSEGRFSDAVSASDIALERFALHAPDDRGYYAANVTFLKALAMAEAGNREGGEMLLRELVKRSRCSEERSVRQLAAVATDRLARLRSRQGDAEGALRLYEDLEQQLGEPRQGRLRRRALAQQIGLLRGAGRFQDALAVSERLLDLLKCQPDEGDDELRLKLDTARLGLREALESSSDAASESSEVSEEQLQDRRPRPDHRAKPTQAERIESAYLCKTHEESLVLVDEVLGSTSPTSPNVALPPALRLRAHALEGLGRIEEAAAVDQELTDLMRSSIGLRVRAALELAKRGGELREAGRPDGALAIWDAILTVFGDPDPAGELYVLLVHIQLEQLELLLRPGRDMHDLTSRAALAVKHAMDNRIDETTRARLLRAGAMVYLNTGAYEDALDVTQQLEATFGSSSDARIRSQVIYGMNTRISALSVLIARGLLDEAEPEVVRIVGRWGDDLLDPLTSWAEELRSSTDEQARTQRASLLLRRAAILKEKGHWREACAAAEEIIGELGENAGEPFAQFVSAARALVEESGAR